MPEKEQRADLNSEKNGTDMERRGREMSGMASEGRADRHRGLFFVEYGRSSERKANETAEEGNRCR